MRYDLCDIYDAAYEYSKVTDKSKRVFFLKSISR